MCTPILAGAISLVGGVIQGIGASKAAASQAEAQAANQMQEAENARAAADAQRREAAIAQTTGAYKAQRKQDEIDRALGAQRAAYAGSGVALTGTPELVISESATEGALDLAAIRWGTQAETDSKRYNAGNYERSAVNLDASARNTIKTGKDAARGAFIGPVLGGVAKFAGSFG
jgi:hypothetical protein